MGSFIECQIEERIAVLTIDHPPVNALNNEVLIELKEVMEQLELNQEITAVIITGAGNKAFIAGADINELKDLDQRRGLSLALRGQAIFNKIANLPVPVIAAINGFALGGGCELSLACDIRIVAANAKIGVPEVGLGVIPGYGGTQRLPRLITPGKAKELIFTGEIIDAHEACRIGLAQSLVPEGQAVEEAKKLAKIIATKSPQAVRAAKKAINQGLECPLQQGLFIEAEILGEVFNSADKNEGMRAFLEKRPANFTGK